jgi:hypothetical protein
VEEELMEEYDIVVYVVDSGIDFVIGNVVDNFVMDIVKYMMVCFDLLNGLLYFEGVILHELDDFLLLDLIHHDRYKLQRTHGIIPEAILLKKKKEY